MKEIPLTQGKFALVDDEDFEWLSQWKWYVSKDRNNGFYAARWECENRKNVYMHREIMNPSGKMQIDHINRDKLDNRRYNLRICTKAQNRMNRGKQKRNTSGYKGVFWDKRVKKWRAVIGINRKTLFLGSFEDIKKAALVYNQAAIKYFGEFAKLN